MFALLMQQTKTICFWWHFFGLLKIWWNSIRLWFFTICHIFATIQHLRDNTKPVLGILQASLVYDKTVLDFGYFIFSRVQLGMSLKGHPLVNFWLHWHFCKSFVKCWPGLGNASSYFTPPLPSSVWHSSLGLPGMITYVEGVHNFLLGIAMQLLVLIIETFEAKVASTWEL